MPVLFPIYFPGTAAPGRGPSGIYRSVCPIFDQKNNYFLSSRISVNIRGLVLPISISMLINRHPDEIVLLQGILQVVEAGGEFLTLRHSLLQVSGLSRCCCT